LILCFLLIVLLIFFYINTKNSLADAEQNLENLNHEKTQLEQEIATINTEGQNESIEEVVTFTEKHIVPTSYLIDEMMDVLPTNGYLSNFNYNYETVNIETQFEEMSDAATYIVELNKSEYVKDIVVNQMNTFEQGLSEVEEGSEDDYYHAIPRYNVSYSIDIHQTNLREASDQDE